MRSPDGNDAFSTGAFRGIVKPERLVLPDSFADADGNIVPASIHGLPGDWPPEAVMTVTLQEQDGGTASIVREEGNPGEMCALAELGMRQSLDKLAEYLEAERSP